MKVDKETLNKIAHLARLEINPDEEQKVLDSLSDILSWVEKLNELDTEGVEPLTNMSMEHNVFREDKAGKHLDHDRGLSNAPKKNEDFFKVPKIKD